MVYFLEFSQPLGTAKHQARYYIGYCADDKLDQRLNDHKTGQGAAITRALLTKGLTFECVATLPGDRTFERKLKNRKNTRRILDQIKRGNIPS